MPVRIQPPVVIREPMRPRLPSPIVLTPVPVPVAPRAPAPVEFAGFMDMMGEQGENMEGMDFEAMMRMALG